MSSYDLEIQNTVDGDNYAFSMENIPQTTNEGKYPSQDEEKAIEYKLKAKNEVDDDRESNEISENSVEEDPWAISNLEIRQIPWSELTTRGKVKVVLWNYIFRQILFLVLMYMFICSLDFLGSAFRLLGGKLTGDFFRTSEFFNNPVAGLVMGVIVTVLVQSSSTSTSIIVAMVSSELLDVQIAIPMIMGANIGTSVTNTIVAMGQIGDRNQFRRAFGGATVHDMFNWLSVIVLLPLEAVTGYLYKLSLAIVNTFRDSLLAAKGSETKLLKAVTEKLTVYVIKTKYLLMFVFMIPYVCNLLYYFGSRTSNTSAYDLEWIDTSQITKIATNANYTVDTIIKTKCTVGTDANGTSIKEPCQFMFMNVAGKWPDWVIGLILLIIALFILCSCLVLIVKILNSIFAGTIARVLKKFVNADLPGKCGKYSTGYIAIVIGMLFTMLVQSSSIFTSALTPLVGVGLLSLERMYPLTLGANIGTTVTGILTALAAEGNTLVLSIQIALCHLFFNISGILIWFPIPFMRNVPITLAKKLGDTTAKYRWFAIFYLVIVFFIFPIAIMAISYASIWALLAVGVPVILASLFVIIVNILQSKFPQALPKVLRTWNFLPLWMHSLKPLNACCLVCFSRCKFCKACNQSDKDEE